MMGKKRFLRDREKLRVSRCELKQKTKRIAIGMQVIRTKNDKPFFI